MSSSKIEEVGGRSPEEYERHLWGYGLEVIG